MSNPKAFNIFIDNREIVEMLTDEQAGQLFKALFAHADGEEYDGVLDQATAIAACGMKLQISRDFEKYGDIVEKRAAAGKSGGEAKASKSKQTLANASKNKQTLANASKNKQVLANASKSKQTLANASKCYQDEDEDEDEDEYKKESQKEKAAPEKEFDNLCNQVIGEYNRVCVDLPKVTKLTDQRRRLLYHADIRGKPLSEFTALFQKAQASDKICGRSDLAWRGDFDWIIKNAVKIMEGSYDNVHPPDKRKGVYSAEGASFSVDKWGGRVPEGCG